MRKTVSRLCWLAIVAAIAMGLLVAACGPAEQPPATKPTAAAPGASPAAALNWPGKPASIPVLGGVPNAPPRPTPVPAAPGTTPPPPPTPPPAKVVPIYAHVDTVTAGAGESKYNVDANLSCAKTSSFARGMHIVWRMEAVDTSTGKILQGNDVDKATLKLPHGEEVTFRYGRHGATEDAPWFWTTAWSIPMDYPIGFVDYSITIATKSGKNLVWKDPMPVSMPDRNIESRLQVVAAQ